jgi:hypothetical protein
MVQMVWVVGVGVRDFKLLLDMKEARERLSQTSRNSSLPPGREAAPDGPADEGGPAPAAETEPVARKRAGKMGGAPGHGRPAPARTYMGHYEAGWIREGPGRAARIGKHLFEESLCGCGHETRAEPVRGLGDGVETGGL